MSAPMLRNGLVSSLTKAPFEALPVSGATPADLQRDASTKECDFILVTDHGHERLTGSSNELALVG